jgi:hypothetical protein
VTRCRLRAFAAFALSHVRTQCVAPSRQPIANVYWAAYARPRYRIVRGCNQALFLGFLALLAIGVFSWAVGQKKEDKKDAPVAQVFIVQPPTAMSPSLPLAAPPAVSPILFKTGQAVLPAEGMAELVKARDYLRGHPDLGVLALAYTDTRGGGASIGRWRAAAHRPCAVP